MSQTDDFETWLLNVLAGNQSPTEAMSACPVSLAGGFIPEIKRPWAHEPHERTWMAYGLPCVLRRGFGGVWCGYVGVPKRHPAYGRDYMDIDIDAHGGLTYGEYGRKGHWRTVLPGIGHYSHKSPLRYGYYWLGFDCGHAGDLSPSDADHPQEAERGLRSSYTENPSFFDNMEHLLRKLGWSDVRPFVDVLVSTIGEGEYRDISYAMAQTNSLAKQLTNMVQSGLKTCE